MKKTQIDLCAGDKAVEENEIIKFRVILKKEDPSTDIKNINGVLYLENKNLVFTSERLDPSLYREYNMKDLVDASSVSIRELFRKKDIVKLLFSRNNVSVIVYFEPVDVSSDFLTHKVHEWHEKITKGTLTSVVGSFIEKIGSEGQKIVREFGSILETSSKEITQALNQTTKFIREATQTANLLDDIDIKFDSNNKTINIDASDIDEILKRSLASEKIDAMITGLIAKGLLSASDQKFQEARDALNIAREAAENENMEEYSKIVDEEMKEIESAESTSSQDLQFGEKALKYANEAKNIVADWEESKNNQDFEKNN